MAKDHQILTTRDVDAFLSQLESFGRRLKSTVEMAAQNERIAQALGAINDLVGGASGGGRSASAGRGRAARAASSASSTGGATRGRGGQSGTGRRSTGGGGTNGQGRGRGRTGGEVDTALEAAMVEQIRRHEGGMRLGDLRKALGASGKNEGAVRGAIDRLRKSGQVRMTGTRGQARYHAQMANGEYPATNA